MKKLVFLFFVVALAALPASAQDAAGPNIDWAYSGIGLGIAVAGAAIGQSKVASAVAEGIARNPAARPGIQLALFLGLAFIESLVLFIWLGLLFLAS